MVTVIREHVSMGRAIRLLPDALTACRDIAAQAIRAHLQCVRQQVEHGETVSIAEATVAHRPFALLLLMYVRTVFALTVTLIRVRAAHVVLILTLIIIVTGLLVNAILLTRTIVPVLTIRVAPYVLPDLVRAAAAGVAARAVTVPVPVVDVVEDNGWTKT